MIYIIHQIKKYLVQTTMSLWVLGKCSIEFQEMSSDCNVQAGNRPVAGVTGPVHVQGY